MNVEKCTRHIILSGSCMVLVGLLVGASMVAGIYPYPRLALTAHIQFVLNGMLFVLQALVLQSFRPRFGMKAAWITVIASFLTWIMAISEVLNSFWGTLETLPIAGRQAGAKGGTSLQEALVKIPHVLGGVALILSWVMMIIGLLRRAD